MKEKLAQLIDWVSKKKLWSIVIAFIVLISLGLAYYYEAERSDVKIFQRVEYPLIDLRHRLLARPERADTDIVVLALTEEAIFEYRDALGRWPWPRRIMAYLFQYMEQADQVLVDIGYWEPSRTEITPQQAQRMYSSFESIGQTIRQEGVFPAEDFSRLQGLFGDLVYSDDVLLAQGTGLLPVYHAMMFDFQQGLSPDPRTLREYKNMLENYGYNLEGENQFQRSSLATIPIEELIGPSQGVGHINFRPDPDGPARRFAPFFGFRDPPDQPGYFDKPYLPMLGLTGALHRMDFDHREEDIVVGRRKIEFGERFSVPLDREGNILIKYRGGPGTYREIPIEELLAAIINDQETEYTPQWFAGKTVLIGATAPGLFDLRATPFTAVEPGVNLHANILDMFSQQDFLRPINTWEVLFAAALLTLTAGVIATFTGPILAFVLTFLLSVLYLIVTIGLFNRGYLVNVSLPLISAGLCYILATVYNLVFEQQKARQIRQAFEHYLTASVMEEVLKDPDKLRLGGERREITVMFGDIAGFTTFSEGRSATEVARVINEILTRLTECVFNYQGVLDKYIGDALVAEFGIIPVEPPHHARRACFAAIDMRRELEKLHVKWKKEGTPLLDFRIGLHTGYAATGNMGSEMLFDYTALGDTVNLGSRLEGANKVYGTKVMISEPTFKQAEEHIVARHLDSIIVKGKDKPISVYELIGRRGEVPDSRLEMIERFEAALQLYTRRDWQQARKIFLDILTKTEDSASRVFVDRIDEFSQNPPPDDWQGDFRLTSK